MIARLPSHGERDPRVDFCRGLALWFILINHAPSNFLTRFTLANFTVADAAEVFVFLAGFSAGLVYGRTFDERGWPVAAGKAMWRAGVIYVAHLALACIFIAFVALVYEITQRDYSANLHILPFATNPMEAMRSIAVLIYQPYFLDILPLYIVLLFFLACLLPLLRHPAILLTFSITLYVIANVFTINFPAWPEGGWFFNPLTWQAVFLIGAILGYRPPGMPQRSIAFSWYIAGACALFLIFSRIGLEFTYRLDALPASLRGYADAIALLFPDEAGKTFQHPMRILSILCMAYLVGHFLPRDAAWLRTRAAASFVLMGRHALPVFCVTVPLSFLMQVTFDHAADRVGVVQVLVNMAALAILVAVAGAAAWQKRAARRA